MERTTLEIFTRGAATGTSYQDLPPERLPMALAELQRVLDVGAPVELVLSTSPVPVAWDLDHLVEVAVGAGFEVVSVRPSDSTHLLLMTTVSRTLPDTVGPGMRLLMCGLNPSLYAADVGVPFARPGNRFWPALLASGLASVDRDPAHALRHHGVGMTDLVKRASVGAAGIKAAEYRRGLARVERLCRWLLPRAVCLVGLAGWRVAIDSKAVAGRQAAQLAGLPVYVMPNTSGRNAHSGLEELTSHLRAAGGLLA